MTAPTETTFYSAFLHELNQPLTTLRNVLELTTYRESNDWPAVVEAALGNVDRMVELLDLMSELSRFERTPAAGEALDFTELLREAMDDLGATARAEGRALVGEKIDSGVRILAVSEVLRSALFRVLGDAIHHVRDGETVTVCLRGGGGAAVLEVSYPGQAFAANEMQSLLALARNGCGPRGGITRRVFRVSLSLRLLAMQGATLDLQTDAGGKSRLTVTYRQVEQNT